MYVFFFPSSLLTREAPKEIQHMPYKHGARTQKTYRLYLGKKDKGSIILLDHRFH